MASNDSIVLELQRLASDGKCSVTELLRKALIVATKLGIEDFRQWVSDELNGYKDHPERIPAYRKAFAAIEAYDPEQGRYIPVIFRQASLQRALAETAAPNPIAELETLANEKRDCRMAVPFAPETIEMLAKDSPDFRTVIPIRFVAPNIVRGMVERVRTIVLEWSLRLEQEGIIGEGMSFSTAEKEKAATSPNIHIDRFEGMLDAGTMTAEAVQLNFGDVYQQLKESGITKEQRDEFEQIADGIEKAEPEQKKSWLQRGMDWIGRNKENLGAAAEVVGKFFRSLAGKE